MRERSGLNELTIKIYEPYSLTERVDSAERLPRAVIRDFGTNFPQGLFGPANIFIPMDVTEAPFFRGTDRVALFNGNTLVYEGELADIGYVVEGGAVQGLSLECAGFWGALLGNQTLNRRYADTRISPAAWQTDDTAPGLELATVDRTGRIRITPKTESWRDVQAHRLKYSMPTGETIGRVKLNYDFQEDKTISAPNAGHLDDPLGTPVWTDLDNAVDGDVSTSVTVTITSDDYIYIALPDDRYNQITFDFGATVNAVAATTAAQYLQEATSTTDRQWATLTITDGTASGGATFAQDGDITFTAPDDWVRMTNDGFSAFWVRLQPSANLTASIVINEITIADRQSWELRLRDRTGSVNIWNQNSSVASPPTAQDDDLGTPRQTLHLEFLSRAAQVGRSDGSIFGEITDVEVYNFASATTVQLDEIVKNIRAEVSNLNSDEQYIDTPGSPLTLVPFMTNEHEFLNSILDRAAQFGDTAFNQWYVRIGASTKAATPDGKPVLESAMYPALTDYEYGVRLDDPYIVPPLNIVRSFANIKNWIVLIYDDIDEERRTILTPDDDANLTDSTSTTDYGTRVLPVYLGKATTTTATNYGRAVLAALKDPKFYINGPLVVQDYILAKDGTKVPCSQIQAGERVRILNFLPDLVGTSGAGLTFIISNSQYNDADETNALATGVYDSMDVMLAQQDFDFT
jgi:hypothetical protein